MRWASLRAGASSDRRAARSAPSTGSTPPRPTRSRRAPRPRCGRRRPRWRRFPPSPTRGSCGDAEKEYAEARLTAALVAGDPLPTADELGVDTDVVDEGSGRGGERAASPPARPAARRRPRPWARTCSRSWTTSTTRWWRVDFPDAITGGLRRTLDALRAVLERTRGDVTTTVLQTRLRESIDRTLHRP